MNVYKSKSKKPENAKLWLARQSFRFGWIYWHGEANNRADASKLARAHFARNIADKVYDKHCLPHGRAIGRKPIVVYTLK
jgi:hypothetical protein